MQKARVYWNHWRKDWVAECINTHGYLYCGHSFDTAFDIAEGHIRTFHYSEWGHRKIRGDIETTPTPTIWENSWANFCNGGDLL